MNVTLAATLRRIYMAPAEDGGDLGGSGALDVESRIANALTSGNDDANNQDESGEVPDGEDLPENTDDNKPDPEDINSEEGDDGDESLAKMLGIDEDKLAYDDAGNVVFKATIDGEQRDVKMSDLVKSYQLEGHVNQKSMKLESDRREFETSRDTAYQELTKRLTTANGLLSLAENSLMQEFQNIDWATLRATDPGEFAATRQYYAERMQMIEQAKAQVGQGGQQLTAEQQQRAMQEREQFHAAEIQKMVVDNPAWSDQNVMAKEVGEIGKFLHEQYGFHPNEVADHMDARLMRMVRDAQAFRSGKQNLEQKKVPSNVPKFRKPNSQNVNRSDMQEARAAKAKKDAVRRSGGSTDAIANLLIDRM